MLYAGIMSCVYLLALQVLYYNTTYIHCFRTEIDK